ncbi:MAG: hypothetical protein ACRDBO_14655 [Lachnospiraceae bacterium]
MKRVQEIRVIAVPKYITEDGEIRLYLATSKKRVWPNLCAKIRQVGCWFLQIRIHRMLLRWLLIISVTTVVGIWAINETYQARGYWAYGGEYLLILIVLYGTYKILHYLGL